MFSASRVAIRTDASLVMGTGHLKRCLSLAESLNSMGAEPCLVVRLIDEVAPRLLDASPWPVHWLPPPARAPSPARPEERPPHHAWACVPWQQDIEETTLALKNQSLDWLVLDHYAFDARWHQVMRRALGCRLLVIDDTADRALDADALLDQNEHVDHRLKYDNRMLNPDARWWVGPRFALLSNVYRNAPRHQFHEQVRSIGVFMGGTDPGGASRHALLACRQAGFRGVVEVVSTSMNPYLDELRQACATHGPTTLTLDAPDLTAFFSRHDLQIGAGGGATWERCCMGAPTVGMALADNQITVIQSLAAQGAMFAAHSGLIDCPRKLSDTLRQALEHLLHSADARRRLGSRAQALVDGCGSQRVALAMLGHRLTLRRATPRDAQLLHGWRNHPAIRQVCGDPEPISWEQHEAWMTRVCASHTRWLWVAYVGAMPVGSIRFDTLPHGHLEVSLYLDPAFAGLGLGTHLLQTGEDTMQKCLSSDFVVEAEVLPDNAMSRRLFTSAGYDGGPRRFHKTVLAQPRCSSASA